MTAASEPNNSWEGKWCWTHKHIPRPWNYYALFRKTIDLRAAPSRAIVRNSADARYTLYVNGQRVHMGPARSWPQFQSYDTIDLADLLVAGKNAICVIGHQFGIPTFQSVYRELSGLLVDGRAEVDGASVSFSTPDGWMCRESQAWRKDVVRYSIMLGFQEHFDADADPVDWMQPTYEPTEANGWTAPMVSGPVGSHPWLNLETRGVPLLAAHAERFATILSQWRGENARGYKVSPDVYHLPFQEERTRDNTALQNPQAMLANNDDVTTLPPPPDGEFVAAVLDLGQYRTGHIILDIADAAGHEIIDIIYSEEIEKNQWPLITGPPGQPTWCQEATADRYRCRTGAQRWESFHFKGMRYVAVIFRNVEKPLKIRHIGVRQTHATVEELGSFECSDERLNAIWKIGRETQRNCLFDAFVDCPWREQAQYWGDARVQSRVTLFAFGETAHMERGIRQVAQSQASDGSLHAHPPADTPGQRIVDFMLTWVVSLWEYHLYTGKTALLEVCLPTMHGLFKFFAVHQVLDGLIGNFDGFWVFLDWKPLFKGNVSAVLNLMYLQALEQARDICEILEEDDLAQNYSATASTVRAAIEKRFWNAKSRHWIDGFDVAANAPVEQVSQHANALAILLGFKPETHADIARDVLLKPARSKRTKIHTGSPFFYAYILEAMAATGLKREAVELIRDKWGSFLDRGATTFWEMWEVTNESRCHAWSASPVYHLPQLILGVTPQAPGWRKITIAPESAGLEFARGDIPTPLGIIHIEWEKAGDDQLAVRVDLPEGMEATFIGPLGDSRPIPAGGQEFHT